MTILAIENRDDVVKHKESAAILAADLNAYQQHLNKRKQRQLLESRVSTLEDKLSRMEHALKELLAFK